MGLKSVKPAELIPWILIKIRPLWDWNFDKCSDYVIADKLK